MNISRSLATQGSTLFTTPNRRIASASNHLRCVFIYRCRAACGFSTTSSRQALANPINISRWLEKNSHLLKPPVNNYCVYDGDSTVMIVGGPNERTDYHINETPEWFYQYKGIMLLKIVDDGRFRDIYIREGDMFLLPSNTPHNPVRFANTVGIVLEQKRPENSLDILRWYCQKCKHKVYEVSFHCTDLGSQIKKAVNDFRNHPKARYCGNCGEICAVTLPATTK